MRFFTIFFVVFASLTLGACQAQNSERAERIAAYRAAEAAEDRKAAEARERTMPIVIGGIIMTILIGGCILVIYQRERGINEGIKEAVRSGDVQLAGILLDHAENSYFPRTKGNSQSIRQIAHRTGRVIEGKSEQL